MTISAESSESTLNNANLTNSDTSVNADQLLVAETELHFDFGTVNLVKVRVGDNLAESESTQGLDSSKSNQPSSVATTDKVLLLLNGQAPTEIVNLDQYCKVYCTDGAYAKAQLLGLKVDVLVGDFDSHSQQVLKQQLEQQADSSSATTNTPTHHTKVIHTPDQTYTDFEKCVQVIIKDGYTHVDVYGSTGLEHDHFLGNLTTGHKYKDQLTMAFIDDVSYFFFAQPVTKLTGVFDHIVSIYPFPSCKSVTSQGLFYPLEQLDLDITGQLSTRNHADADKVQLTYTAGDMLVFICRKPKTYVTA